jgi:cold shock CspA family protein
MPLSDDDYNRHSTYYGLYSAAQTARVTELLEGLGVRFEFVAHLQPEEQLRAWNAWDPAASEPREGHDLFIHDDDIETVGMRIVELYPERGS